MESSSGFNKDGVNSNKEKKIQKIPDQTKKQMKMFVFMRVSECVFMCVGKCQ